MKSPETPAKHFWSAKVATLGAALSAALLPTEVHAQEACVANKAVYARDDGSEFLVRYVGESASETGRELFYEGELITAENAKGLDAHGSRRSRVAYVQRSESGDANLPASVRYSWQFKPKQSGFEAAQTTDYERDTRFKIRWLETPGEAPPMLQSAVGGPAWDGSWKLVRCDGRSDFAAKAIAAGTPLRCPADRLVFIDEHTGLKFTAKRYGEDFKHAWTTDAGKAVLTRNAPPSERDGTARWSKVVGYYAIFGTIDATDAYLWYEQIWGVPCCTFSSYYPGHKALSSSPPRWLQGKAVPLLMNKTEFLAENVDLAYAFTAYERGPLTGMSLVPIACRKN